MTVYKSVIISALDSYIDKEHYYIRHVTIEEGLSEITKTTIEIFVLDQDRTIDVWNLNIAVSSKWSVFLQRWVQEEGEKEPKSVWTRTIHGVVSNVHTSLQYVDEGYGYIIMVELRHPLFLLSYNKQYHISNFSTHGSIIENLTSAVSVYLINTCIVMQLDIHDLFIQFGECDLHLFERLVQTNGAFYICDDNGHTVGVHDTTGEYTSGNHYEFGSDRKILRKIFNLSMEQKEVPMEYKTVDYDHKSPSQLYGIALNLSGTGKWTDYPAMQANGLTEIQTELQAFNLKKRFVNKKYMVESSCYDIKPMETITIDKWSNKDPHVVVKITHNFSFSNINHQFTYHNTFVMHETKDCYVSPKELPAPLINSVQTATVMTLSPILEIETNSSCEIFIQFHWLFSIPGMSGGGMAINQAITAVNTALGFSCWVPVAQILAGTNYGSFIVPRIGDEVLVYFIDGNPNRPIVFGGIYNKTQTSYFARGILDQFTIVLMRSATFYENMAPISWFEPNTYNEISITDIPFDQRIYLKAQKNIEFDLGMLTSIVPSNFKTSIMGIGSQSHDIMWGDYSLNILLGNESHSMNGHCSFEVNPGLFGGNFTIEITDGKLLILAENGSIQEFNDDLTINVTGDCRINVIEGETNITSEGKINITSEDSITMKAPNISFIAEEKIHLEASNLKIDMEENIEASTGENIKLDVLGSINMEVTEDITIEAGGSIKAEVMENVEINAMGAVQLEVMEEMKISTVGAVQVESAEEIEMKAAMGFKVEAGMECEIKSGLTLSLEAGLEFEAKAGLSAEIKSGLELAFSSGLMVETKAGLEAATSSGLMIENKAGLMLNIEAGLMAEMVAGLMIEASAGLMFSIEAGMLVDLTGGLGFDAYANLFISGESVATMFCLIPG